MAPADSAPAAGDRFLATVAPADSTFAITLGALTFTIATARWA